MKPTLIFISHLGLQHIQKQKNSKRVGYIECLYYNRMTLSALWQGCRQHKMKDKHYKLGSSFSNKCKQLSKS